MQTKAPCTIHFLWQALRTCLFIFAFWAMVLNLNSCHIDLGNPPTNNKECGPFYLGKWRDYIYFKKGSWWVYRSIFEGDTLYDTVTVTSDFADTIRYEDKSNPSAWIVTKEYISYTMKSTVQGLIYHEVPEIQSLNYRDTVGKYYKFLLIRHVWGEGKYTLG